MPNAVEWAALYALCAEGQEVPTGLCTTVAALELVAPALAADCRALGWDAILVTPGTIQPLPEEAEV